MDYRHTSPATINVRIYNNTKEERTKMNYYYIIVAHNYLVEDNIQTYETVEVNAIEEHNLREYINILQKKYPSCFLFPIKRDEVTFNIDKAVCQ